MLPACSRPVSVLFAPALKEKGAVPAHGQGKRGVPAQGSHVRDGAAEARECPRRFAAAQEHRRFAGEREASRKVHAQSGKTACGEAEGDAAAVAYAVTQAEKSH